MIRVTIEASTPQELGKKVQALAEQMTAPPTTVSGQLEMDFAPSPAPAAPPPAAPAPVAPAVVGGVNSEEPAKRRGRPPKSAAVEPTGMVAAPYPNAAPAPKATREQAMVALNGVVSSLSLQAARDALSRFGCARISELPEARYGEFVVFCVESVKAGRVA